MHDLGVLLHSYNGERNFREAAKKVFAAEGKLRFNAKYLDPGVKPTLKDSPVLGIERTMSFTAPGTRELLDGPYQPFEGTLEQYAQMARARLLDHIRANWDASRPTLFLHSNGYDSRILSSCLVVLREEGFDLGAVHFRCHEPEGEHFRQIMKRQGWKPEQYSVFQEPKEDIFDVGHWDKAGVAPWLPATTGGNFWRDIVPYEEEKNWNLFGGTGGGETCEYPTLKKAPFVNWKYCANPPVQLWFGYFADGTDWAANVEARFAKVMFPYWGTGHIATIAALPDRFLGYEDNGCDHVRAAILRTFKDSLLDLPRALRTYRWSISPARWESMGESYKNSQFRKDVPMSPAADVLLARMQKHFFTNDSWAERLWRLAAVWDSVVKEG